MRLEQSFDVSAPIDVVWEALIDVERVAPCLPGASIKGRTDDGGYAGEFAVKVGPTSASYSGKLHMTSVDEASHTATMEASGTDKRGQGGASATIVSRLSENSPGSTLVHVDTDYRITGRLARFGRGGMIEDISERLLREFAACLQGSLGGDEGGASDDGVGDEVDDEVPPAPAEALDLGSVAGGMLIDRIRSNRVPLMAALATLLLIVRRCRRRRRS